MVSKTNSKNNNESSLELMTISNTRRGLNNIREAFKRHSKESPFCIAEIIGEIVVTTQDQDENKPRQQLVFYSTKNKVGTDNCQNIKDRKWVSIENFAVLYMITHLRKRRLKNNSQASS
jgi:hypothetical protein